MNLTNIFRFRKPEGTDPVNVEDFNDNFDVIDTELNKRPEKTGNASDMVTTFSQAASRANLTPGEKISVSFGKIMKYFADMKTVAFTGSYADLSNKPSIPGGAAASQAVANNCTTTAAGSVLDARQGKVLMDKANQINSDLGGCKISWDGSDFWAQNGSSKKKLGSAVPSLIVNKVGVSTTSNSKSYTSPGEGYVIVSMASWSNSAVTFSVSKNGSPVSPSSSDGVSDRNKYLYCWSIPVNKGDVILASAVCSAAADLYLNMYAVVL